MNIYERILKLLEAILKMVVDRARDPEKVADALQAIVDGPVVTVAKKYLYLRHLYETEMIVIGPTDGKETFKSSGLFTGGIGINVSAVVENPTPTSETKVAVHEMIEDGNYRILFDSLGQVGKQEYDQSQIVAFCRVHPNKLRKDGYGTFFRLKDGFIASVSMGDFGRLRVDVDPFSYNQSCHARYAHRLVTPQ
jgi:hypothetical protein